MLTLPRRSAGDDLRVAASTGRRATVLAGLLVVIAFGVLAYQRWWISDDGLIVVREVKQILAGNGPNYNPFQRDEVDTSTLWTWMLAAAAFLTRGHVAADAVVLGLACSVGGLSLAMLGAARFHRPRGEHGALAPVGALVPLGVAAFWDFATSGLETGLSILWLGACWWRLVATTAHGGRRQMLACAVLLGLGPLVRPEFALATILFGIALLGITRPGWRRGLACCVVAAIPSVGYEVFRAGYYGILVPMPALAKEASSAVWARGFAFLNDFLDTYQLWIPIAVTCVAATATFGRPRLDRRSSLLVGAPVVTGVLMGAYVVRVGGDYMHGRMWLPAVFTLLLPVMLIPVGRARKAASASTLLVAIWALLAGLYARTPYQGIAFGPNGITNERSYEAAAFSDPHPAAESRNHGNGVRPILRRLTAGHPPRLILGEGRAANGSLWTLPLASARPDHGALFYDNMGIAAVVTPLDVTVVDVNGLASPIAGHLQLTKRGRPGHEKWLPVAWVVAEYAAPSSIKTLPDAHGVTRAQVLAARHALSCGRLADLMASVNEPMSAGRFWRNLTGAVARTGLRVPANPFVAEQQFCG